MGQGRRLHFTRAPREDSAQRGITFLLLLIVCHRSLHLDILLFAHFREGNGADPFCPNFNFLTPSFISLHPTPPPSPLPRKPRKPKLQLCQITTNNMKGGNNNDNNINDKISNNLNHNDYNINGL